MNLDELKTGQSANICAVNVSGKLSERLNMLNIFEGAKVTLLRRAPFGGGFLLEAGGVRLALRKNIAEKIQVTLEDKNEQCSG